MQKIPAAGRLFSQKQRIKVQHSSSLKSSCFPAAQRSPPGLIGMSELNKPLELFVLHVAQAETFLVLIHFVFFILFSQLKIQSSFSSMTIMRTCAFNAEQFKFHTSCRTEILNKTICFNVISNLTRFGSQYDSACRLQAIYFLGINRFASCLTYNQKSVSLKNV